MSSHPLLALAAAHSSTYLIGGGGKTTLMYHLARLLLVDGRRVITTTSTHLQPPEPRQSPALLVGPDLEVLAHQFQASGLPHSTLARERLSPFRLAGFSPPELDELQVLTGVDHLLVEADGSAGRSLKAHAAHEPVVSPQAGLVLAVIGVGCLGLPVQEAWVHRAALMRERLGLPAGAVVTPDLVARAFFHPLGYVKAVPSGAALVVVLTKVDSPRRRLAAETLRAALLAADQAGRVGAVLSYDGRRGR